MACQVIDAHATKYSMEKAPDATELSRAQIVKSADASSVNLGQFEELIAAPRIKLDVESVAVIDKARMPAQVEFLS